MPKTKPNLSRKERAAMVADIVARLVASAMPKQQTNAHR